MERSYIFKLIEGDFSPTDTRELLLNVFQSKIQFHQMKNFSSQEKFGKKDEVAEKRIPQLRESMQQIIELTKLTEDQNERINISSEVILKSI